MSVNTQLAYKFEQANVSGSVTLGTITDIVSLMEDDQTICLDGLFFGHYSSDAADFFNTSFTRMQFGIKKTSSGLVIINEQVIYFAGEFESGANTSYSAQITGTSNENIEILCTTTGVDADVFARLTLLYVNV